MPPGRTPRHPVWGLKKNYPREQNIWSCMLARCGNPNHTNYRHYGGRGICVCERWRESFWNFFEDMGPCPSPELSIDRINNDGNYEPGNCRWATAKEQAANHRLGVLPSLFEYAGERLPLTEWARRTGIRADTIRSRLFVLKWSMERALAVPAHERKRRQEPPRYLHHKPSGRAYVHFEGRSIYLGRYDSDESRERYKAFVAEWTSRRE